MHLSGSLILAASFPKRQNLSTIQKIKSIDSRLLPQKSFPCTREGLSPAETHEWEHPKSFPRDSIDIPGRPLYDENIHFLKGSIELAVDLSSYLTVAERIAEFRAKYPEGSLQPVNLDEPFKVVVIGDKTFITYVAAAYRTPDDPVPWRRGGVGGLSRPDTVHP